MTIWLDAHLSPRPHLALNLPTPRRTPVTRAALLLLAVAAPTFAQTADVIKEGGGLLEANAIQTVEYDIRPLLYKPGSARAGFDSIEQIVREVTANIGPGTWNKPNREIGEKNGTHLVVTASVKCHGDIRELLKTLTDRTDLAVDVTGSVYELDRKEYETALLPQTEKGKLAVVNDEGAILSGALSGAKPENRRPEAGKPATVSDGWAKLVAKSGKKTLDGTARIATGRAATVASSRKAVEYLGTPGKKASEAFEVEFVGTTITAAVRVPRERRSVFVSVTETTRELVEVVKGRKCDELRGEVSLVETPRVAEAVAKADAGEVPDGAVVAVPLTGGSKDTVRVLILRPVIFIQSEEDAIRKAEAEKKGKK